MKLKTLVFDTVRFDPGVTEIWDGVAHRTAVKALGRRYVLAEGKLSGLLATRPLKAQKRAFREWEAKVEGPKRTIEELDQAWERAVSRYADRVVESVERRGPLVRIVLGRKDYARNDESGNGGVTVSQALRADKAMGNLYHAVFVVGSDGAVSLYSGPMEVDRLRDGAYLEGACRYVSAAADQGRAVAVFSLRKEKKQ